MRIVQIAVCVGGHPDASESLYALGEDGQIYMQCHYYNHETKRGQGYWGKLDMVVGRDAAIEATKEGAEVTVK